MPTREQTINDAIQIYENALSLTSQSLAYAWLGIYQSLLWLEPIDWLGFTELPHIIDADKLRPNSLSRKASWKKVSIWQQRAEGIRQYLARQLMCSIEDLPSRLDLLMKQPNYDGKQRQNTLGIAFAGLIKHSLEKFGSNRITYEIEVDPGTIFRGITFPGRSNTPRIDILAIQNGIPCAIISSKWSLRHDRLNDITNECPVYKAAYERIYRGNRLRHLRFYVATNEFDPARLNKILDDSCVDGVIHVHKPGLVNICQLDGRLEQLIDLVDFVNMTPSW